MPVVVIVYGYIVVSLLTTKSTIKSHNSVTLKSVIYMTMGMISRIVVSGSNPNHLMQHQIDQGFSPPSLSTSPALVADFPVALRLGTIFNQEQVVS